MLLLITTSCNRDRLKLKPIDDRPIKSIDVADMDEAELLKQELGLEIKEVENSKVYYFVKDNAQELKLTELGYTSKKKIRFR